MATVEPDKILVVDDSPQISKALSDLLSTSGYLVRTAPSAERALQILESVTFDLIITDLKMTGMTGIDLARQVLQKTPDLPVVILTGFGDMDSVITALRLGVADYLKKPFSIETVTMEAKPGAPPLADSPLPAAEPSAPAGPLPTRWCGRA